MSIRRNIISDIWTKRVEKEGKKGLTGLKSEKQTDRISIGHRERDSEMLRARQRDSEDNTEKGKL